jgi:hypothetical protein
MPVGLKELCFRTLNAIALVDITFLNRLWVELNMAWMSATWQVIAILNTFKAWIVNKCYATNNVAIFLFALSQKNYNYFYILSYYTLHLRYHAIPQRDHRTSSLQRSIKNALEASNRSVRFQVLSGRGWRWQSRLGYTAPCSLLEVDRCFIHRSDDGSNTHLWNVSLLYMALYPRRLSYSSDIIVVYIQNRTNPMKQNAVLIMVRIVTIRL